MKNQDKEPVAVTAEPKADEYPLEELVAASREVFHVPPECAAAALRNVSKKTMAVEEASAIITKFMKKEVK